MAAQTDPLGSLVQPRLVEAEEPDDREPNQWDIGEVGETCRGVWASTPPPSAESTNAALSTARVRPIHFSYSSFEPVSSTTLSYTTLSTVPELNAK
jgi:hypothetical protein